MALDKHVVSNPAALSAFISFKSHSHNHVTVCIAIDSFVEKYAERQKLYGIRYGLTQNGKADPFDVKQAAFLTPWDGSGIGLVSDPDWSSEQYCLEAKTKVICNKLQLELVPYASAKFAIIDLAVLATLLFPSSNLSIELSEIIGGKKNENVRNESDCC